MIELGVAGPWWATPLVTGQVRNDSDRKRLKQSFHSAAQGQRVGRWSWVRRDRWVSLPGMAMYFRLMVLATTAPLCPSPRAAIQRIRLWARVASTDQAALAVKVPDGQWAIPAPSFRSRMANSTTAWWRWSASRNTAVPSRSVMKAWCRHEGNNWACLPTNLVRRMMRRCPSAIGALGHLGLAADRVVDVTPLLLGDGLNGPDHGFVQVDGDGVADIVVPARFHHVLGVEARVGPQGELAGGTGTTRPPDGLPNEPLCSPARAGRSLPLADVEDLARVGPGGDQRVLPEYAGVAIGGPLLLLPIDLLDGGVDVDDHRVIARTSAERPCSGQHLLSEGVELADMAEGEGPEERAEGGGGHYVVSEHAAGRSRTQHVAVVDALGTGHHGVHQGGHFAAGTCVPGTVAEVDQLVRPGHQIQPLGQQASQRQASCGHRPVVVEGHGEERRIVRFCVHRKDALSACGMCGLQRVTSSQDGGIFRVWSDLR